MSLAIEDQWNTPARDKYIKNEKWITIISPRIEFFPRLVAVKPFLHTSHLALMAKRPLLTFCFNAYRYSPPQVCRKLKIQDIVKKYRHERSVPDFYVSLFSNDAK